MVMVLGTQVLPALSLIWTVTPNCWSNIFSASPTLVLPLIFRPSAVVFTSLVVFLLRGRKGHLGVGQHGTFIEGQRQVEGFLEVCRDSLQLLVRRHREFGLVEGVFDVVNQSHICVFFDEYAIKKSRELNFFVLSEALVNLFCKQESSRCS